MFSWRSCLANMLQKNLEHNIGEMFLKLQSNRKESEEEHKCVQEKKSEGFRRPEGFREIGPVTASGI